VANVYTQGPTHADENWPLDLSSSSFEKTLTVFINTLNKNKFNLIFEFFNLLS
jgi:hypothetical protein